MEVEMSSTLNPDEEPQQHVRETANTTGALGPSDSSDSELDNHALETGDSELGSDTDRHGTGERAAADGDATLSADADIEPDRVIDPFAPLETDETDDADASDNI
jgi:hypothetical protein